MKKRILGVIAFAAVAIAAGWNYQQSKQDVELSDLAMENVEALARDEGDSGSGSYQTMGYCTPSRMNYMCTNRPTAEPCRRHCP